MPGGQQEPSSPAAKRVKLEPGVGAATSSSGAPGGSSAAGGGPAAAKDDGSFLDGLDGGPAADGAEFEWLHNPQEIEAAGVEAGVAKQKLDQPQRFTLSMNLLQANVDEQASPLYFLCEAKKLKKVAQAVSLICRTVFYYWRGWFVCIVRLTMGCGGC